MNKQNFGDTRQSKIYRINLKDDVYIESDFSRELNMIHFLYNKGIVVPLHDCDVGKCWAKKNATQHSFHLRIIAISIE